MPGKNWLSDEAVGQLNDLVRATNGQRRTLRSAGPQASKVPMGALYAKVTGQHGTDKWRYEAEQVVWNDATELWDTVTNGREWGAAPKIEYLIEINKNVDVDNDEIVVVFHLGDVDGDTRWFFAYEGGFIHPHQVTQIDNTHVRLGAHRSAGTTEDWVDNYMENGGAAVRVQQPTQQDFTISAETWLYYKVDIADPTFTVTALQSAVWPLAPESFTSQYVLIAHIPFSGGKITGIGQELFSNPVLWARPMKIPFLSYYNSTGVTINSGIVIFEDGGNGAPNGVSLLSLAATEVWFEITYTPSGTTAGPTAIATGAMQAGPSMGPSWEIDSAGKVTKRVKVGHTDGTKFIRDLPLGTLYLGHTGYTPTFHDDVDTGDRWSLNALGINAGNTATGEVGDNTNEKLVEWRTQGLEAVQGNIRGISDGVKTAIFGTSDEIDKQDFVEYINADVNNEIEFVGSLLTHKPAIGVTQENEVSSGSPEFITVANKWMEMTAKEFRHKPPPTSGQEWKTGYIAATSGGSPTIEVKADVTGHWFYWDGDNPGGPSTMSWKYQLCDDAATVIYRANDDGASIDIGGLCYKRIGESTQAVDNAESFTAWDDCATCAAGCVAVSSYGFPGTGAITGFTLESESGGNPTNVSGEGKQDGAGSGKYHRDVEACTDIDVSMTVNTISSEGNGVGVNARHANVSGGGGYQLILVRQPSDGQLQLFSGNWQNTLLDFDTTSGHTGSILLRCVGTSLTGSGASASVSATNSDFAGAFCGFNWNCDGGQTQTFDNWATDAPPACPLVDVVEYADWVEVCVRVIGSGVPGDPFRADLPQGVKWKYDDSIPHDLSKGVPMFDRCFVSVRPDDLPKITQANIDDGQFAIVDAIRRTRRNAYFVPKGMHPPAECHVGDSERMKGHTWPHVQVPGGTLFYRPAPFVSMVSPDDDGDRERAIERDMGKSSRALYGLRSERASVVFDRMADDHRGKVIMRKAVKALMARGLNSKAAIAIAKRHGVTL